MIELYKIAKAGEKVYVRTLWFNAAVWNGHQWLYGYVTDTYPTDREANAKDFGTVKAAKKWIKEHMPS